MQNSGKETKSRKAQKTKSRPLSMLNLRVNLSKLSRRSEERKESLRTEGIALPPTAAEGFLAVLGSLGGLISVLLMGGLRRIPTKIYKFLRLPRSTVNK